MHTCQPNRTLRASPATLAAYHSHNRLPVIPVPSRKRGDVQAKPETPNRFYIASVIFRAKARDLAPLFGDSYAIAARVLRYHMRKA